MGSRSGAHLARDRGEASTFTFTSLHRPASSVASCSRIGLTVRHGPHHGAHRSTITGSEVRSATSANVASSASATQGNGDLQRPQRGVPVEAAGTRLRVSHDGQVTTERLSMVTGLADP